MRLPSTRIALLLVTASALAGCGQSSDLLDASSADELKRELRTISTAVAEQRCDDATAAVSDGARKVEDLPGDVDEQLVSHLRDAFSRLRSTVESECAEATTTTDTTTTTTETPTTTTTEPEPTTPDPSTSTPEQPTGPDPGTDPGDGDGTGDGDEDGSGGVDPGAVDPGSGAIPRGMQEWRQRGREQERRMREALRELRRQYRGQP
ncbi:lipoprotein [Patulibacter brassicae]|uniref:Lipoprotein n=1 Tax=Patulibacter brassicae TaxID=1705717 RepID=A0ABU4VNS1_9ACTN|nr:lipoprotein [Patulibacter brassicae]MDX8153473.1 lipoprotein [Patulibacter brassicae]